MSVQPVAWPTSLAGTPAIGVIERAIENRRLSHSLLLSAEDADILSAVAIGIADRLLSGLGHEADAVAVTRFAPDQHPDCFFLRPAGKMRQISADATRELIGKVQVSATMSSRKVAIIFDCDRMNMQAANIFLKTLEEPPANTILLLLTTRPYALLPTIRSRCLHFRFPTEGGAYSPDGWSAWLADYRAWLDALTAGMSDKKSVADSIFTAYGLIARFDAILTAATAEMWTLQKEKLPGEIDDDEKIAIETGIANGLRARLFVEIEQATRTYALPKLKENDDAVRRAFTAAIGKLEHAVGLLRVNLNESAALEEFLLASLRIWTKR
ncbi:MAG TPA: DNA polymerase III subunit gamma/tau [Opitutaceae bacterium]|nr:DNA polymerase III subunit gamma/tau [Opitutaceae bacterium]